MPVETKLGRSETKLGRSETKLGRLSLGSTVDPEDLPLGLLDHLCLGLRGELDARPLERGAIAATLPRRDEPQLPTLPRLLPRPCGLATLSIGRWEVRSEIGSLVVLHALAACPRRCGCRPARTSSMAALTACAAAATVDASSLGMAKPWYSSSPLST